MCMCVRVFSAGLKSKDFPLLLLGHIRMLLPVCKAALSSMLIKWRVWFVAAALSPVLCRGGVWWEQDVLDDTGGTLSVRVAPDALWKHVKCSGKHIVEGAAPHAWQVQGKTVTIGAIWSADDKRGCFLTFMGSSITMLTIPSPLAAKWKPSYWRILHTSRGYAVKLRLEKISCFV